jgi:hypothetical protein
MTSPPPRSRPLQPGCYKSIQRSQCIRVLRLEDATLNTDDIARHLFCLAVAAFPRENYGGSCLSARPDALALEYGAEIKTCFGI